MVAFYTRGFRDLFFSDDPPKRMFQAIVTVLAGYWRPSFASRVWLWLFFMSVRMQTRFGFAPSHLESSPDGSDPRRPEGLIAIHTPLIR